MRRTIVTSLLVWMLLLVLMLIAPVARAEEIICQDTLGAVTVDNLRIPTGTSCTLDGTHITGNISVENEAILTATQVSLAGNLQAEGAQRLSVLAGSIISGSVQIKNSGGVEISATLVNGDIQAQGTDLVRILAGTSISGSVQINNSGTLEVNAAWIEGDLQTEGAQLVQILAGTVVSGTAQLKQGGAAEISEVLINGDLQLELNALPLSITRNQVGGNVQVFQNLGGVGLVENIIHGNLQCKENDPPPIGGDNDVKGNREDQCAALGMQTLITSGPNAQTASASATFSFMADEPGSTFECSLDDAAFTACTSPVEYPQLAFGSHLFKVRAIGPMGNVDAMPARYTWWVVGPYQIYLPTIQTGALPSSHFGESIKMSSRLLRPV